MEPEVTSIARQKAEAALVESEAKFRLAFESANVGKSITLPHGEIEVNQAFCDMLGYTREELSNKTWQELTPPEELNPIHDLLAPLLRGEQDTVRFEKRYIQKSGSHIWTEVGAVMHRDNDGKPQYFIVTIVDITERKRAEEALRKNEEQLRLSTELANVAVWEYSFMTNSMSRSNNHDRLYGLDWQEKWDINTFLNETHPDDRRFSRECIEKSVAAGGPDQYKFDFRVIYPDHSVHWLMAVGQVVERDAEGKGRIVRGCLIDISDRKQVEGELKNYRERLEERVNDRTIELGKAQEALVNLVEDLNEKTGELTRANERLREVDRLKSMFIASMSHELRTPLNSIIGFTGILLQGMAGDLNEEQTDQLRRVKASGQHLLSLINDVIDVSKIEAGQVQVYVSEFLLSAVVQEAVTNLKGEIARKGLFLEIAYGDAVTLNLDRRRLLQCLLNLLSNAVKYTEKGTVRLSTRRTTDRDWIEISVADTGIGIKEEDLPLLFSPFTRLESPLKIKNPGTGLGLYLTQKIAAELLGGEVAVESTPGKGSTFMLRFPIEMPKLPEMR